MNPRPAIYRHPARPEWGHGILVEERDAKLILHWEDGQEHVVASAFRTKLEPAELADDDAQRITDTVKGLRAKKIKIDEKAKARAKARPRARATAAKLTFDQQVERFTSLFPQGFTGSTYERKERGIVDGVAVDGGKQAAIDLAKTLLAPEALLDPEAAYASVQRLLGATNLVFPIEGAIPFRTLRAEHRAGFAEALRDLLHGEGGYPARFDAFVAAIRIEDGKQVAKRPTWPLATLLPALYQPHIHGFIKPKLLQEQAITLGLPVNYQPLPSGAVYDELLAVLKAVEQRLREAGQAPRDLMDSAAFVWTTLAPTKSESPAAAPSP